MYKEIAEQFDELGCEVSKEILDKCSELCTAYNIDPVEFVEQWMAFSVSNLNGAEPTIPFLVEMERKVFASIKNKEADKRKKKTIINKVSDSNITAVYGNPAAEHNIDEDVIMDTYNCKTPKTQKSTIARTPARENVSLINSVIYSPISASTRTQTEKIGKVVYTFGNGNLIKQGTWVSAHPKKVIVQQLLKHNNETLHAKTKYMYDILRERAWLFGDRLFYTSEEICKKIFEGQAIDIKNYDNSSHDQIKIVGTIACDFDGKLDPASTILIESRPSKCSTLELDFSEMKSYSVFPGQTVVISGSTNYRYETILVKEINSERILSRPIPPQITNEMHFVIVSGPYINQDDLLSDSLHDIIFYCKEHKPDVLIMTSPWIDAEENIIMRNNLLETSFDSMIADLIEALGMEITICIVASHNDILANTVYPTPPISTKHSFANVHMLPDPSIIDINGFSIGVTSTDIVKHLCEEELAVNLQNKVDRIVGYLFHQQSFYPLNPPNINVPLDLNLANKFARIEKIPNVMILPSSQEVFIRDVSGSLAINPGKICCKKRGTFAHLTIYPPKDVTSLSNYMACRILKV